MTARTPLVLGADGLPQQFQSGDALIGLAPVRNLQSSAYSVQASDLGKLIECTGTWTLGTLAAATAGAGFYFYVKKTDNTGVITIDPNSAETIAGLTSIALYGGECGYKIWTDGTAWYTLGRQKGLIVLSSVALTGQTLANQQATDGFGDNVELAQIEIQWWNVTFSTTNTAPKLQLIKGGAALAGGCLGTTTNGSSTTVTQSTSLATGVPLATGSVTTTMSCGGSIRFNALGVTGPTQIGKFETFSTLTVTEENGWIYENTASALQGVLWLPNSGTISSISYIVKGLRQ